MLCCLTKFLKLVKHLLTAKISVSVCLFVCTCLLCCSQAILRSAQDAADQTELIHCELCGFRAFFLLQQTADGKAPSIIAGSRER